MATNIKFHRITATSGSTINTETNYTKGDVYFIKSATGNTGKVYICTVAGKGTAATLEDYSVDTNTWRPVVNNLTSTSTDSSLSAAMGKSLNDSITSLSNSLASHTHDGRYYTESEVNDLLANKSNTGHTHTKSQITDFAHTHDDRYYTESEMDTKLGTKSDTGHTHSFSEITPGVATIGDGANRLMFRTNSNYKNGIYYSTPGNEALVFGTITPITSWIFATTDPTTQTAWTSLTPSLQIKNGRVTINKLIANNTDASYNLDVNGSANATTLYENGVRVSVNGHTHDDRYYTESEIDTKLATKSDTGHTHTKSQITDFAHTHTRSDITDFAHNHDDRYYTESEVNNLLANKSNTSHTHSYIVTQGDNRSTATKPSDYSNRITFAGLKTNSTIGSPSSTTYNYVVGLRGWSDTSGGKAHELAFNDNGIFHRIGATDTWESWDQLEIKGNTTGYLNKISKSGNTLTITPKDGTAFTFTNTTYSRKWDDNASNSNYPGYGDATSTDDSFSLVNVGDMKRWNKASYMLEGLETLLASI